MKIERPPVLHVVVAVLLALVVTHQISASRLERGRVTLTPDGLVCGHILLEKAGRQRTIPPVGHFRVPTGRVDLEMLIAHGALDGTFQVQRGTEVVRSTDFRAEAQARTRFTSAFRITRTTATPEPVRDSMFCATPDSTWVVPVHHYLPDLPDGAASGAATSGRSADLRPLLTPPTRTR